MKHILSLIFTLFLLIPPIYSTAEQSDFINSYMCTFHENNIIGPRVISLADGNVGSYIDMIGGYVLEMKWERKDNMLYVNPIDTNFEQLQYIIINDEGTYRLVDFNGNLYKPPLANTQRETNEDTTGGGYTIDDILGKWICKEEKQILHIKPQYTSHFIFEGGGMANDSHKIQDNTLELKYTGTFTIEPLSDSLKLVCTKTGYASKGTEFVKVEDIVDEEDLYGTWKGTTEPEDSITIDESGVYYILTTRKSNTSKTTRSGSSSLDFAGDTLYIRAQRTLTIVNNNGIIELVSGNEHFVQ